MPNEKSGFEQRRSVIQSRQAVAVVAVVAFVLAGCTARGNEQGVVGDPKAGAIIISRQACGSCHEIPGVGQANGTVGPSLQHFASRKMVAGLLPNTPLALARWLKSPQSVLKGNAMPDMGLSDEQARDVAAYLHTLK